MSPALYSLYTEGLCSDLPEGVEAVEFANDIGLYVCGSTRCRNRDLLQWAVDVVVDRLYDIGLEVAPQKTVLVEFNKHGRCDGAMSIRVRDCEVTNSSEAKFLGIWLDNGLSFSR